MITITLHNLQGVAITEFNVNLSMEGVRNNLEYVFQHKTAFYPKGMCVPYGVLSQCIITYKETDNV